MVSANTGIVEELSKKLQWSHVFSDMVSAGGKKLPICDAWLQWSHVFSDMVSDAAGTKPTTATGFNGAMSFQTW